MIAGGGCADAVVAVGLFARGGIGETCVDICPVLERRIGSGGGAPCVKREKNKYSTKYYM